MALLAWSASAATADISVNDTSDVLHATGCALTGTGTCTLRDAITFANSSPGRVVIAVHGLFRPTSPLPSITGSVTLDGSWYPLQSPVAPGVIDGSLAGPSDGLTIAADECVLLGLTIRWFEGSGIVVLGANNYIGDFVPPPCTLGCRIEQVTVSGNGGHGIEIRGGSNNTLRAVEASMNGGNGIYVHAGATLNRIGFLGWARSVGVHDNRLAGVRIGDGAGDTATHGNTIDVGGVSGNGGSSIDLGGDGATSNDALDADTGPNGFQNFPTVTSAMTNANDTVTASGTFGGAPNATFALRFHRAETGENPFEDNVTVTTDSSGFAAFSAGLSYVSLGAGPHPPANTAIPLVAAATDASGNTSELSGPVGSAPPKDLALYTIAPCRILDTREDTYGAPALMNGRPRAFGVPSSCGVPSTARALVVNLTVTNATASGHVRLAGTPWPANTSTINFQAGQTRANNAVVTLGRYSSVAAMAILEGSASGAVDLILDVSGYLE